jgi:hypothetical protein
MPAEHTRSSRRWRRVQLLLAGVLVLPCAVLAIGAFVPSLPYLGTAGSAVVPLVAPQIVVVALLGTALAFAARRLGARRAATALALSERLWRHQPQS